ncbi:MAG TPA: non-canonical purine NTP pyrophosphatase, partial [Clostridiaceae bacterium]|nr:non-canonical purine NTP pyrophosphatase [Clostridiaceae bacterium]
MNTLLIATKNQGKVKEIKEILWDLPYLIKSLEELKID